MGEDSHIQKAIQEVNSSGKPQASRRLKTWFVRHRCSVSVVCSSANRRASLVRHLRLERCSAFADSRQLAI